MASTCPHMLLARIHQLEKEKSELAKENMKLKKEIEFLNKKLERTTEDFLKYKSQGYDISAEDIKNISAFVNGLESITIVKKPK